MTRRRTRFFILARALARTAGAAALRRAIPTLGGLGLVSAILFAPNGLDASTVTALMARSIGARAALWIGWLILATPISRALLGGREAAFLKSMPVPRAWSVAVLAALSLSISLPFAAPFYRGEGLTPGLTTLAAATALAAFGTVRPIRPIDAAIATSTAALAFFAPPAIALPFVSLAAIHAVTIGWSRARDEGRSLTLVAGPRSIALALAYASRLLRIDAALLLRGLAASAIGGAAAALGARNNELTGNDWVSFVTTVCVIPFVLAAAPATGSIARAQEGLARIVLASGVRPRVTVVARTIANAGAGVFAGLVALGGSSLVGAPSRSVLVALAPPLLLSSAALSVAAGEVALRMSLRALRIKRDPGGNVIVGFVVLTAFGLTAHALLESRGAVASAALAVILTTLPRRRALPSGAMPDVETSGLLSAHDIVKTYGGRAVLDRVSFAWPGPGTLVLCGENGAGKSTLLAILAGVIEPDSGLVMIGGKRLDERRELALGHIGWVPDAIDLPEHLSVAELVTLVASLKGVERPSTAVAERLGVRALLGDRLRSLSLGQRRRAGLLAALSGDPPLLILDEPTNGLDIEGLGMLKDLLRERAARGQGAVIATHDRAFASSVADGTLTLTHGKGALA